MLRGVVERINWRSGGRWTDGTVDVALPNGSSVSAAYLSSYPPTPRSIVWVQEGQPGAWIVLGAEGGSRLLFHDDFFGSTDNVTDQGDTNWVRFSSGSYGLSMGAGIPSVGDETYGLSRIRCTSGSVLSSAGGYYKVSTAAAENTSPIYLAIRVSLENNSQIGQNFVFGYTDSNPAITGLRGQSMNGAWILVAGGAPSSGEVTLYAQTGLTQSTIQLAEAPAATTWLLIEMLIVPGQFVAAWCNGDGPFIPAAAPPETGTPSIWAMLYGSQALPGTSGVDIDWIHAEVPVAFVPPTIVEASSPASAATDSRDYGSSAATLSTDAFDLTDATDPADTGVGDG